MASRPRDPPAASGLPLTPAAYLAELRRDGHVGDAPPPTGVLLCTPRVLRRRLVGPGGDPRPRLPGHFRWLVLGDGHRIGVAGGVGVGAPGAVLTLEELIAWGVHRFVAVGVAWRLGRSLRAGEILLCTAAIPDDGTSRRYLLSPGPVPSDPALSADLAAELGTRGRRAAEGRCWTVDSPLRLSPFEVRRRVAEGAVALDLEVAALLAVAGRYGIQMAAARVVAGSLAEVVWEPHLRPETVAGLDQVAAAALAILGNGSPGRT